MNDAQQSSGPAPFSEREFYRREFRGRTLALALPGLVPGPFAGRLDGTLAELRDAGARVVVIAEAADVLASAVPGATRPGATLPAATRPLTLPAGAERLEGEVWRGLQTSPVLGVDASAEADFAAACTSLTRRLGLFKLVWLDEGGGLVGPRGERLSFVHQAELHELLAAPGAHPGTDDRAGLWRAIEQMLEAGVPAVNVCSAQGLDAEMFTYAGSGTLFTRERYMDVRRLGVDDYDAAWDLIGRGVEEGYLAPRAAAAVDGVLACGFGAFVEGSHLAGLGALLPGGDGHSGEIASLYTLTRFLGEGVGVSLVGFALERARALGYAYIYACTTSDRVGAFFERNGFAAVGSERVPVAKWQSYDPARRERVRCFRRDLVSDQVARSPNRSLT